MAKMLVDDLLNKLVLSSAVREPVQAVPTPAQAVRVAAVGMRELRRDGPQALNNERWRAVESPGKDDAFYRAVLAP
jgi:hypothetical protein